MLIDAAGNEMPSNYCKCGRHKLASTPTCCRVCAGSYNGMHSTACHMRQEHFPDTRRGVVFSEVDTERQPSFGSLPVARVERIR